MSPSVALHYGSQPPRSELAAFDWVVLEPDHPTDPSTFKPAMPLAYVAVGEAHPSRSWFARTDPAWVKGRNQAWGSQIMDMAAPEWQEFLIEKVMFPLWQRGYRGFFLDTLDSHLLVKNVDHEAQWRGLATLVRRIKTRMPDARLILNRGFEILADVAPLIDMVAAESLYRGWDAGRGTFREVAPSDRAWLLERLAEVRGHGLPCLVIDYTPVSDRALARDTARRIEADGCIPYVTDPDLRTVGIGLVEAVPRRVLVLYYGKESEALRLSNAHRYLQMPLEYLGYLVDYVDVDHDLPEDVHPDRYAGIVSWFSGAIPSDVAARLDRWWLRRLEEGLPFAVLDSLPTPMSAALLQRMGLRTEAPPENALTPAPSSALRGLEWTAPLHAAENVVAVAPGSESRLAYLDDKGREWAAVAITPTGGIALHPFVVIGLPGLDQHRWIIDPFGFVQDALRLPRIPVPDVTTENGRRLLTVHIDGDGFVSRAELPGAHLAGQVLLEQILERYRVPTSMSIIEAETAPWGLYPHKADKAEEIARAMFRLPHVEAATHTYSHPFVWGRARRATGLADVSTGLFNLNIPGYSFDLEREIVGSSHYIETRLAPADKPVRLLHWSGNCSPDTDAIALADRAGLLNINGGDTSISRANPTLTAVGSLGLRQDGTLQVYAPITNENIYTNLWTGPFDGYRRVIETLKMTDHPRRLKPLGIYYHTYSASKPAALRALQDVYEWALAQPVFPVFTSEYVRKVRDFYTGSLARRGEHWIWRGIGDLRTLRLPPGMEPVDLAGSEGVAGWADGPDGRYVHLAGAHARLRLSTSAPAAPRLVDANARVASVRRTGRSMSLDLVGHRTLEWSAPAGCQVVANGKPLPPHRREGGINSYRIQDVRATIDINCAG